MRQLHGGFGPRAFFTGFDMTGWFVLCAGLLALYILFGD